MNEHPSVAGWYADPAGADRQRYWDGAQWTERRREPPPDLARTPLLIAGYAAAVLSPILGLVIGIALMIRGETRHGSAIVAVSLVAGVAGALLWPTPFSIATWVTGVIAVFVGIPVAIYRVSRARRSPGVAWDGARWAKRTR